MLVPAVHAEEREACQVADISSLLRLLKQSFQHVDSAAALTEKLLLGLCLLLQNLDHGDILQRDTKQLSDRTG